MQTKKRSKKFLELVANPRLLACMAVAWFITNGWSYALFAAGTYFDISWMTTVAGAYLTFLWMPFSPEKLVTLAIAIALLRQLYPDDEKTLGVLREIYERTRHVLRWRRERKEGADWLTDERKQC